MPQLNWLGDSHAQRTAQQEPYRLLEKSGVYFSNEDSREKLDIGSVWAQASAGRCVFAMVTHASITGVSVATQLRKAIGA